MLVADLPNLGPKSQEILARVGISNFAQLREIGAINAYIRAKQVESKVSLNLLWALEGALSGKHWRIVAREQRSSLLLALEDAERQLPEISPATSDV